MKNATARGACDGGKSRYVVRKRYLQASCDERHSVRTDAGEHVV